jgi:sugar O-acyltransferase (sialic acid O-acetyltransferase NeuD family)
LTGWAQVHGRNRLSWEERIELDLDYVDRFSLWLDLEILARTVVVLARGDGVYAPNGANDDFKAGSRAKKPPLVVVGAGGHARVVIDAIEKEGRFEIVGLVVDGSEGDEASRFDYPVLGGREVLQEAGIPRRAVVAIGSPLARGAWIVHLKELEFELPCIRHPAATIGRDVRIAEGAVLLAGSVVNAGASLGCGVIVNTGASVDHDCELAELVHVAPGARLAGNVRVGPRSHIGIGACVIQNVTIGNDAIIGAGAAVVGPITAGATAVGVPARIVRLSGAAPVAPAPSHSQPQT